jgi:hypothetical protein
MRHLLFILSERPRLFEVSGLILVLVASILQLTALIVGPTKVGGLNIFDLHTKALLLLAGLTGTQAYLFACMLFLKERERPLAITRSSIEIDEASLFFLLSGIFVVESILVGAVVANWASNNFANLDLAQVAFAVIHFLSVPGMLLVGLLALHVFKKSD